MVGAGQKPPGSRAACRFLLVRSLEVADRYCRADLWCMPLHSVTVQDTSRGLPTMKHHRRASSAPELGLPLLLEHLSPRKLFLRLHSQSFEWFGRKNMFRVWSAFHWAMCKLRLHRLSRRGLCRYGVQLGKALLVIAHLLLVCLLCKVLLYPASNPWEEWSPWSPPWGQHSWSELAFQRKALREEIRAAQVPPSPPYTRPFQQSPPPRLKYPVLWAAPFFSRSGYGTEAISYVVGMLENGLIAPEDLWITQAGDCVHGDALDGLDPSIRQLLWDQEWHNITRRLPPHERDRPLIVICHVFPDCWRTSADDYPSRWAVVRWTKWLWRELAIRLYGIDRSKENGCPCPNEYIKDRVVYRVGRSMFETEKLPQPLVQHAEQLDEVLVPSQFSVDSFTASGIPADRLHTLPQGINITLFNPDKYKPINLAILQGDQVTGSNHSYNLHPRPHTKPKDEKRSVWASLLSKTLGASALEGAQQELQQLDEFVTASYHHSISSDEPRHHHWWAVKGQPFRFLSVFKWETRKGWDVLLRGFFEEFSADDDVELHVVTHAFGNHVDNFRQYMRDQIKNLMNVTDEDLDLRLPRVYVYDKYIPDGMYPGLYQAMDALVVPTHGEGWGRPQFEAMAMGLPVISTNWSGLTAFMDDTVSYPIAVEAVVEVKDDAPDAFYWFKNQKWAQPSLSHLRQLMRQVMSHGFEAIAKGQAAKKRIQEQYSIPAVAKKAASEILRIQREVDLLMGDALREERPAGLGMPIHV